MNLVTLEQERDYRFLNRFGESIDTLVSDEDPPVGTGQGPTPLQLLGAAVGNCLAASLLFALRKFKQSPEPLRARVETVTDRNEQNRMRVVRLKARIDLGVPAGQLQHLERALAQFEDFCTVTASVRAAIPVDVEVYDAAGKQVR